jgi:1-deoxy-D-xylulose-5-phosphate reductoisomerase
MAEVTPESALKHPNWAMGEKATIDSATLMHKGIEMIEAHFLFDLPFEKLEAIIHPQSIVHSLVEFVDGSIKAQLSYTDMRLVIQYMLTYPERWQNNELPRLDLAKVKSLEFEPIDLNRFPAFPLALEAGRKGGTYPAVLCASDEVAVNLFLNHQIGFLNIARLVEDTLSHHQGIAHPSLEEIWEADRWAREYASGWKDK